MSEVRAIVVGGTDFGEADRIVHVLGARGRESWFAHGARKSRRRFAGTLEPFATVRATLEPRRRQGMVVIASMVVERARTGIGAGLERLALAAYAAELCARVAPEGAEAPELEQILAAALDRLDVAPGSRALRVALELVLLAPLGYRPDTHACVVCGREAPAGNVAFELSRGGVLCAEHAGAAPVIGPKTRAWVEAVLAAGPAALADPCAGLPEAWADTAALKLARTVQAVYASVLEAPLRSAPWLEQVLSELPPPAASR